jgi:hypothetical protein
VGEHWVKRDPAAAFEWLSANAVDEEGAEAIRRVVSRWLKEDRPAAEAWLDSASPAALPDPALDVYARDLAQRSEIETAIYWAEHIRDASLREACLEAVATP